MSSSRTPGPPQRPQVADLHDSSEKVAEPKPRLPVRQLGNFSLQVITFPGFEASAYAKTFESSSTRATGFLQGPLQDEVVALLPCATLLYEEVQCHEAMTATFGFKSQPEKGSRITLQVFQAHFLHSSSPLKKHAFLLPGSAPFSTGP